MDKNQEDLIKQKYLDIHYSAASHWNSHANEQELELTKQMLAFGTIFFTLSASLVALDKTIINNEIRIIILFMWFFLLASLICGVIQIIININYFVYLMTDETKRMKVWKQTFKSLSELTKEEQHLGKTKPSSGHIFLILQGVFVILTLVTVLIIGVILLFI